MKNRRNDIGASEIVGTILLLAIVVASFSAIYFQVLSDLKPEETVHTTVIGYMEEGSPVLEIQKGESLGPDTKIIITVAGFERKEFILRDLHNQEWNIGGRIDIPIYNTQGVQVEGMVVDKLSNSIVFMGVLQEGFKFYSRGGIWHFDEDVWKIDIPDEVKDSSGNDNHGIALNNAHIVNGTQDPQDAMSNNSGIFNGYFDVVRVETSWTLNITDRITIEAWMKPQRRDEEGDLIEVEGSFGYNPYVIHAVGDVYAMVSEDSQKMGRIATMDISDLGEIDRIQSVSFDGSKAKKTMRPIITKITEELYLVAYNHWDGYIHLRTYFISSNGSIKYTGNEFIYSDYQITNDPNLPNRPSLLKITENICAIVYWGQKVNDVGILKTLRISNDGMITNIETITYDPGYDPCIVHINANVYAFAYRDISNHGIIKTLNINSDGHIYFIDEKVYSTNSDAYQPSLIKIADNFVAVTYRDKNSYGYITVIKIMSNGMIMLTDETELFESTIGNCYNPFITHIDNEKYVIAYSTADNSGYSLGYIVTLNLSNNGSISQIASPKEFEYSEGSNTRCFNPIMVRIKKYLFAVSYEGFGNHPGKLITLLVGNVPRGICKDFSYVLNANTTAVEACIDNVYLRYYNDSIGFNWNHFAVTYDGLNICLYVNGIKVNETSHPNHQIYLSNDPLYLGKYYCGFIDEIAIYDEALTQEQIIYHFNNPGKFL